MTEDQTLQLNSSDFQKAAIVRKTGHKFTMAFRNGKTDNIGLPEIAKNLSSVLLFDPAARELLMQNGYTISLDTKCQLFLKKAVELSSAEAGTSLEAVAV